MRKQDIRLLIICFDVLPGLESAGIPVEYAANIDRLKNLIETNKKYRIIVVCKANHVPELYNIITGRYIHKIYTLGCCIEPRITNKEVTVVNTNEQELIFHILIEIIRYAHQEELIQKKLENNGLANALATDELKLLDLIKTLL